MALFLAICCALATVLTVAAILASRALIARAAAAGHPRPDRVTGEVLTPRPPAYGGQRPPGGPRRWVGWGQVATPLGWLAASYPLAVLELEPPTVTFRIRGGAWEVHQIGWWPWSDTARAALARGSTP